MVLLIPSIIQFAHSFENHEHVYCFSIDETHVHELEIDCTSLHRQFQSYDIDFSSNLEVIPQHFYSFTVEFTSDLIDVKILREKNPRGPPTIIV